MLYKYMFWATCKLYKNFEGDTAVPGLSAILLLTLLQYFPLLSIAHITDSIFHFSWAFNKLQIFVPALVLLLWNYIWLYKINNLGNIFKEMENLTKSKSEFYTLAIAIHIFFNIGLFWLALEIN